VGKHVYIEIFDFGDFGLLISAPAMAADDKGEYDNE